MELSWSTFVLEIINFLVLVWILKRFLYKPVLEVIARRRSEIERTLTEAKNLHAEAEKLQKQYEGRLSDWQQEREKSLESLAEEIKTERASKMKELHHSLEQEREKGRVAEERRQTERMRNIESTALAQGAEFASRLLKLASGGETEKELIELMVSDLENLSEERISALRSNFKQTSEGFVVASAFPIPDEQRRQLEQALAKLAGREMPLKFEQKPDLLAGVRIQVGAWVLAANLQDELKGFADLALADEESGDDNQQP